MNACAKRTFLSAAALLGLVAATVGGPTRATADVVILSDGSRLEGIATTSTLVPDVILFSDHVNKSLRIPRARVQEIVHEQEPASRLRIAQAYGREGKYEQALEQIREARRLAPEDPVLLEEERTILRALAIETTKQAELEAQAGRELIVKIREAMESGQFEKALPALAMLHDPTLPADVRDEAARLKIRFYEKWGDDRADKTDTFGAIECYETVMDLDPNAKETYTKLMRLYEQVVQPGENAARGQKLQEYLETKVAQDPKNLDARLRLANLLYMRREWDGALEQYLAVYRDTATTSTQDVPLSRVEARLRALFDGRHRKSAEQHDYDLAIQQFREYQSFFPDVDNGPLYLYEYRKKSERLGPGDDDARIELVRYCERYGLGDHARKELFTVLKNNPQHGEALRILEKWARADLTEIEAAFQLALYAQIPSLVAQIHAKYPIERYPSLKAIHEAADDYVERARNETRAQMRDKRKRALELAEAGDTNFERGMSALYNYRDGAGVTSRVDRYGRQSYARTTVAVGSYKADAIMYLERALRYYREALALDPSLATAGKQNLRRKMSDCQRYLSLLKSQRIRRSPPGTRSARRFKPQTPSPQGYNPYYPYGYPSTYPYGYQYGYPYGSSYGYPYGSYPYGYPSAYPYGQPLQPFAPPTWPGTPPSSAGP